MVYRWSGKCSASEPYWFACSWFNQSEEALRKLAIIESFGYKLRQPVIYHRLCCQPSNHMPRSNRDDRLEIDFSFQPADVSTPADDDEVFPIAILGDFSGGANRSPGTPDILARIDCDNFEKVFAQFGVSLRLAPPGTATEEQTVPRTPRRKYLCPREKTLVNIRGRV